MLAKLRKIFRKYIFPTDEVFFILKGIDVNSALDVGAGTGFFLEEMVKRNLVTVGHGVEVHQKYFRSINDKIKITDSKEITGKKFDLLIFNDVLHHIKDKKKVINNYIEKNLKSTGYILVKEMDTKNILYKYFNKLHDLIFAGELIHEISSKKIDSLMPKNVKLEKKGSKQIFLYDHYFKLYQVKEL